MYFPRMQYTYPFIKLCINAIQHTELKQKLYKTKTYINKAITQVTNRPHKVKIQKTAEAKAIRWQEDKANRFATTHKAIRPGRQASRQS